MAKEMLSQIEESGAKLLVNKAARDIIIECLATSLHASLEFDPHPTPEEEQQGKADCSTSSRYFEALVDHLLPNLGTSIKAVNRSVWEPPDKKANAHIVVGVVEDEEEYLVDSTPKMGPGFGSVQRGIELHATTPLHVRDLEIITKIQIAKHLYSEKPSEAERFAYQIDQLQIPPYLYSWKASLDLLTADYLTQNGLFDEALERLRKAAGLNPYKIGILGAAEQIATAVGQPERLDGVRSVLNENIKKLKESLRAKASEYAQQAKDCFGQGDLKTGLVFLRLAWWVDNILDPKKVVSVSIDSRSIPITVLTPKKFCNSGMVSVWTNQDLGKLPDGFDVVWEKNVSLYKQTDYGYKPIELSSPSNRRYSNSINIVILKPSEDIMVNELFSIRGVCRVGNGVIGFLNSIGIAYPQLTTVDRFSIEFYRFLGDQTKK